MLVKICDFNIISVVHKIYYLQEKEKYYFDRSETECFS